MQSRDMSSCSLRRRHPLPDRIRSLWVLLTSNEGRLPRMEWNGQFDSRFYPWQAMDMEGSPQLLGPLLHVFQTPPASHRLARMEAPPVVSNLETDSRWLAVGLLACDVNPGLRRVAVADGVGQGFLDNAQDIQLLLDRKVARCVGKGCMNADGMGALLPLDETFQRGQQSIGQDIFVSNSKYGNG